MCLIIEEIENVKILEVCGRKLNYSVNEESDELE